jgi:predicted DCC family thiol-disulfide oxidoreductase YuxK
VNTEITDKDKFEGWVLYDGECGICTNLARRFRGALARRRFELLPLQTPWIRVRLALPEPQLLAEMRLLRADGAMFGGADALLEIGRRFWWAWPLRQFAKIPAAMRLLHAGYRWVARNRGCANAACEINHTAVEKRRLFDFLPLLVLPPAALILQVHVAPWIFMWAMAFALYAGCKWLTFREAIAHGARTDLFRAIGYLLAWPGMNAAEFLDTKNRAPKPRRIEWAFALAKILFGATLLWGIAQLLPPVNPIIAGWIGMIGVIFMLHFGAFHLLSLAWRRVGIAATPVMQNPLLAISVAEFWGRRWNTAFKELAFRFTLRPLRRLTNPATASLLVFGLSGLIHELVISLPAGGGFGLPTMYFLAQGLGLVIERSRLGRQIGLGRGVRGRIFTIAFTAAPAFWLFHPPFIRNVILPMFTAIGAT